MVARDEVSDDVNRFANVQTSASGEMMCDALYSLSLSNAFLQLAPLPDAAILALSSLARCSLTLSASAALACSL
jgi:hypothetical protein